MNPTSGTNSKRPQIDALTSLRFLLAAMVLVGHFFGSHPEVALPPVFGHIAPVAVSWFFMLSGFVMAYNYPRLSARADVERFLILRWARLWPVHAVLLAVAYYGLGHHGKPLWLAANLTLTHTWFLHPGVAQAYNGPAWSISTEWFFYIMYVGLAAPSAWVRWCAAIVPLVVAVALPVGYGCFVEPASLNSAVCESMVYIFPPARFVEFLIGVGICLVRPRVPQALGIALMIGALLGLTAIATEGVTYVLERQAIILVGGGAIIAALARLGWLASIFGVRPLVFGGEISYSMYMSHQIAMSMLMPLLSGLSVGAQFSCVVLCVMAISTMLYLFVERPARNAVKSRLRRRDTRLREDQSALAAA